MNMPHVIDRRRWRGMEGLDVSVDVFCGGQLLGHERGLVRQGIVWPAREDSLGSPDELLDGLPP